MNHGKKGQRGYLQVNVVPNLSWASSSSNPHSESLLPRICSFKLRSCRLCPLVNFMSKSERKKVSDLCGHGSKTPNNDIQQSARGTIRQNTVRHQQAKDGRLFRLFAFASLRYYPDLLRRKACWKEGPITGQAQSLELSPSRSARYWPGKSCRKRCRESTCLAWIAHD